MPFRDMDELLGHVEAKHDGRDKHGSRKVLAGEP
jgi:hypothetical protein